MMKIRNLSKREFFKKYGVFEIDLVGKGLYSKEDLEELINYERRVPMRIQRVASLLSFAVGHPKFAAHFMLPRFKGLLGIGGGARVKQDIREKHPIRNCILKASIAAAFQPKTLFEIGTYLGWGVAGFKFAMPECRVYTLNLDVDLDSENPIDKSMVGSFCKQKKLKFTQLWGDSTTYGFKKLPKFDVSYIDGSHKYEDVIVDLANLVSRTKKCIIVDDYVPGQESSPGLVYGPWNEGVVRAVDEFLMKNDVFESASHIWGSQLCVLVMKNAKGQSRRL